MSDSAQNRLGDVALLLYAGPFIFSFVYALYLWAQVGLSSTLPSLVYVEVAQDPYLFLAGFAAVVLAGVLDFRAAPMANRKAELGAVSKRLQSIAVLSVVLAVISALYSAGFDLGGTLLNLLGGRYDLVFPAVLVLFSFLILPAVRLQGANMGNLLVILLLIASPAALYELGKRNTAAGLGVALVLILAAAYLLVRSRKS